MFTMLKMGGEKKDLTAKTRFFLHLTKKSKKNQKFFKKGIDFRRKPRYN